jgi:hypothetical protein
MKCLFHCLALTNQTEFTEKNCQCPPKHDVYTYLGRQTLLLEQLTQNYLATRENYNKTQVSLSEQ